MLKQPHITTLILTVIFFCLFSFVSQALAQTPQEIIDSIQNNIQVVVTPQYPKAGDRVSIHLQSNSTPLDQANITWIVSGATVSKGFGMTDFSTTAGKIGSVTNITARIVTASGKTVDKTVTIQPADVDLLWQASSYVPPFYAGKALYPHQGLITFTAVPNVTSSKDVSKSLGSYVYTWKKDGDVLGDYSGYGKNTFTLRGTIISRPFTMRVDVSSVNGVSLGSASVRVNPQSPQVALYENNPLLGVMYNRILSNFVMQGKELTISAVPYYFNSGFEPAILEYKWTMNGQRVASQNNPAVLTVRDTAGIKGQSTIGLQISNALKTLQFASNSFLLNFDNSNPTGL